MAGVDGTWDVVVKSPLGDQKLSLTVTSSGDTFTGKGEGAMGAAEINGTIEGGNTLVWKQQVTTPMPMTLDMKATAEGDTLSGTVGAGAFGSFPLTGTRTA
jgi:hypothetical protein